MARMWDPTFLCLLATAAATCSNYALRVAIGTCFIGASEEAGWTLAQRGSLLGAFFWGYLLGNAGVVFIVNRWGGYRVLGAALCAWSACALFLPFAFDVGGYYGFWGCTALLGFVESVSGGRRRRYGLLVSYLDSY